MAFLTSQMFASSMIRVFSKFGTIRRSGPHPVRQFVGFSCCHFTCTPAVKHNRAKQMFELPSARTFIAGGNEFLFARFYDVYEGVQLVQLENSPIVSGVPDIHRRIVKTWKRHGIRCKHPTGRNAHIFSTKIFHLHFQRKSAYVLLIMLLIHINYTKGAARLMCSP